MVRACVGCMCVGGKVGGYCPSYSPITDDWLADWERTQDSLLIVDGESPTDLRLWRECQTDMVWRTKGKFLKNAIML